MHLADRQNYFTILRNLLVILFVTIPAWADHSNPDDLETVRLLISGGSGGLMGGHQARVILPMLQPESPFSSGVQTGRQNLAETRIGHSKVFKQKGCYLFSYPHLTIKKFMEKISSLGQRWALKIDKFPLLQDENGFIFSYPGRKLTRKDYFLLINRVLANFPSRIYKPRPAYARLYDASLEGKPVYLLCQNGDSPDQLEWQWDLWQTRWSVYQSIDRPSSQDRFMVISKYWGVGPRRIQAIKEVKKDHSQTILLDSGDILEGFSSLVHGRFSLHRANSLKMIKKLGFQALCPGELELSGGFSIYARQLKQIGIKPVITNVDTKDIYLV